MEIFLYFSKSVEYFFPRCNVLIIITTKESNSRTVTKQMPTPNEKAGPDLNSKIFPLQFRMLFYFCSLDFLDEGPVSSAGSTLPLSLLCRRSVSSVLGLEFHQYNRCYCRENVLIRIPYALLLNFSLCLPFWWKEYIDLLQSGHCYENH